MILMVLRTALRSTKDESSPPAPAYDVLTTELISEAFNHPIHINRQAGRWTATARPGSRHR